MKKLQALVFLAVFLTLNAWAQEKIELVPFGDFESWTVRYIKESEIIGGAVKPVYVVGPKDTLRANAPYDYRKTVWASSNVYAHVAGISKGSNSVVPEKGPSGLCARLETVYASVKAVGVINIKVVASGALFWGRVLEPITSTKNTMGFMDWGIPFTKRPKAMILDYKAHLPNTGKLAKGTGFIDGDDPEVIMLMLQNRYEDADGNIHAKRVGTAYLRIEKSTDGWMKDARIPVIYGDASKSAQYKDVTLKGGESTINAVNSKGKSVPILEEGWASPDTPVTHAIMSFSTGSRTDLTAAIGNILWIDNIRLAY